MKSFEWTHIITMADTDAAGVVFFARVFPWFHQTYEMFLREIDVPVERILAGPVHVVIAHAEADYRRPMRVGDPVRMGLTVSQVHERSFVLSYCIAHPEGETTAVGKTTHVAVDRQSGRACALPAELRQRLIHG